ncbi:IQ-DOMAIN 1-like protein [Tanacetum coccineum]
MGRKGNWVSLIKKALSLSSKGKKGQVWHKFHRVFFFQGGKNYSKNAKERPGLTHAYSVAVATAAAAEAAAVAAQVAAESVRLAELTRYSRKSKEETAAIRIQTALRGYLTRRALRVLRWLVRLKTLVEGTAVKRQMANTLKCMQNLSRVQPQINSSRIRMSEESQALQKQLLQKQAKEMESL